MDSRYVKIIGEVYVIAYRLGYSYVSTLLENLVSFNDAIYADYC
jgi:hypothetical protein